MEKQFCHSTEKGCRKKTDSLPPQLQDSRGDSTSLQEGELQGRARPGKISKVVGEKQGDGTQMGQPGTEQNLQGKPLSSSGHQDQGEAQMLN